MELLLAKASEHFHSGRYSEAGDDLQKCQRLDYRGYEHEEELNHGFNDSDVNGTRKRARFSFAPPEFLSLLPHLAVEADEALCRALSCIIKLKKINRDNLNRKRTPKEEKEATINSRRVEEVINRAIDTNASYRRALSSASLSLRRYEQSKKSSSSSFQGGRKKRQRQEYDKHNEGHFEDRIVVTKIRKQIAISSIMAGTSECWLWLNLGELQMASLSLEEAARLACSCFFHINRITDEVGKKDKEEVTVGALSTSPPQCQEVRLDIMQIMNVLRKCLLHEEEPSNFGTKMERGKRGEFALRTLQNAMSVVSFASNCPSTKRGEIKIEYEDEGDKIATSEKQQKSFLCFDSEQGSKQRMPVSSKDKLNSNSKDETDCEKQEISIGEFSVRLKVQELLTKSLIEHNQLSLMFENKKKQEEVRIRRDSLIDLALTLSTKEDEQSCYFVARKIKFLFDGLNALSRAKTDEYNVKQGSLPPSFSNMIEGTKGTSLTCRHSSNLLGCIFYLMGSQGETKKEFLMDSIYYFGQTLKLDECQGLVQSEKNRATILNMVNCFTKLRQFQPAVELLLHLLSPDFSSSTVHSPPTPIEPVKLIFSSTGMLQMSSSCNSSSENKEQKQQEQQQPNERVVLLWKLFYTSSLIHDDRATCLSAIDELRYHHVQKDFNEEFGFVVCARNFALLQMEQHSKIETFHGGGEDDGDNENSSPILNMFLNLYEADSAIHLSMGHECQNRYPTSSKNNYHNDHLHIEREEDVGHDARCTAATAITVESATESALNLYERLPKVSESTLLDSHSFGFETEKRSNFTTGSFLMRDLGSVVWNNRGISNLVNDNTVEAMYCFHKAAVNAMSKKRNIQNFDEFQRNQIFSEEKAYDNKVQFNIEEDTRKHLTPSSMPTLKPHFNLTLLFLKEKNYEAASTLWLSIRGLEKTMRKSSSLLPVPGKRASNLKMILDNKVERYQKYILNKEKNEKPMSTEQQKKKPGVYDYSRSPSKNVDKVDSSLIGGINFEHVLALDIIVLKRTLKLNFYGTNEKG